MKKNEIKGLSAFELLEGLDDDMILSASLPEAVPVAPPTVGEKITAFFARMGKGGMAAAITGIVVAVAVLVGIALARPLGVIDPSDTDPSHGIHGSLPDTDQGIVAPPLTQNPEQEKGPVAVTSDGITVYPQGYCVWESGLHRNEQGELEGYDADGRGAVDMLDRLWDMLPVLRTAGNTYEMPLPDHMTLRDIRVFEMISLGHGKAFEEIALAAKGTDPAIDLLNTLTGNGGYVVVLDIYTEIRYSEDEYTKSLYEYAFVLEVDPSMNDNAPVRVIHGGKTYFPTGYLLEESYYDAELKKEVVKKYDGATYRLGELIPDMVTATLHYTGSITPEGALSLYLAPFYELKEITVYDADLNLIVSAEATEPLEILCSWGAGDYYAIISATFAGTGAASVTEFPIHVRIVEETSEETSEETYPNDDGETPEPPRLTVSTGFGSLHFGNASHSDEYHEGYMLRTEQWYDGGMISGDGFGAEGQLSDISAGLPVLRHNAGEEPYLRVYEKEDTLTRIAIYFDDHSFFANAMDWYDNISRLTAGRYIIVLRVETQGDYIEEAEAYERTCTEYAFWLDVVEPPETNPRVVVSGGGQSAVFETEEDGFLAWREVDLSHIEGTRAADVIFTDDAAMRALPKMEIFYSDRLTVTLDAAGDELFGVILYDAKGEMIAKSNGLWVVDSLENDGWDRGVILVLQIISSVSETERVCYEYAIDLTIRVPAPPSGEPVDVMVGSEFILPYAVQVSVREWTGSKFDGWNGVLAPLSRFADEIPTAEYTATTRIRISSEQESLRQQEFKRFEIWDADFNLVKNETPNEYTALDDLHAALNQLSPGTYYLILEVVKYGQYVESHHQWEEWETNYYVALRVS